jgi:tetratricopeptide (TPR) repeat protein
VELLVREENLDLARGRAILAASLAVGPKAVSESFRWNAEVRAQIKLGLLDDARQTASSCQDAHSCIEALLLLSAAYAKAGQAEAAKMTRDEAFELLPRINDPPQADGRAQMLLKTGFLDEAEQELRRLMRKDNLMLPAFSRVAEPLLKARLERGEIATAFELAVDWSVLNDDPEALATLYSLVEKTEAPPPDFSRYLRHMREIR